MGKELQGDIMPGKYEKTWSTSTLHPGRDALIIDIATQNPLTTAVQVKITTQVNVGVHTVRKRLPEAGPHHRTPATKPFFTQANREGRLGFALEYFSAEAAFWKKVVFCDEKTFASEAHGPLRCWRPDNTR